MNIIDIFKFVYKNMIEKKGRVFLTISGIVIGIFTFTFFIFVSQGLSATIEEQFSSMGANMIYVQKIGQGQNGPPVGALGLTDNDVNKIKQVVRDYKYIAPAIMQSLKFDYGKQHKRFNVISYRDEDFQDVINDVGFEVSEGRLLRPGDRGGIVIGYKTATEGYEDRELSIGNSLKIDDKSFRIIGILKEKGDLMTDNAVLMPFHDIKEISGQETYGLIRIGFQEGADLAYYKQKILDKFNPKNGEKQVEVGSADDIIQQMNQIIGLLTAIITFVSSIALIVGGINVMNTMYSNVIERINEISVMKALGGTNGVIRNIFLIESSVLGFIGAFIGFFSSFGLAKLLGFVAKGLGYNIIIKFNITFFIGVIIITMLLAAAFGTYPAIKASYINPADNLRDE